MRILLINPNTTTSMTRKIGVAAAAAASAGTVVSAVNPQSGPESIEGYFDEALSVPGLLDEIRKAPEMDAYVVACFDDTGLDAARCVTTAPVLGIGEAAFHLASLIAGKFSVVTTLARSVPAIETNLIKYGLASRCARVRASDVAVLELEKPDSDARQRISQEIAQALSEDRAEAIVLGCAGMTDLAASLAEEHGVPVLDGVVAAVKLCEGLVGLGLRTSKVGGYAVPRAKRFAGVFASYSKEAALEGTR
jgi:allantoin racemase